jgi:hypothetical protein
MEQRKKQYARKVCIVIGIIGILILVLFNWNFHLVFLGQKYESEILKIENQLNKCYQIEIEYTRASGELVQRNMSDCTAEAFLFLIEEGNKHSLWESQYKPYKVYMPFLNFAVKIFLLFFMVIIPFLFAVLGR